MKKYEKLFRPKKLSLIASLLFLAGFLLLARNVEAKYTPKIEVTAPPNIPAELVPAPLKEAEESKAETPAPKIKPEIVPTPAATVAPAAKSVSKPAASKSAPILTPSAVTPAPAPTSPVDQIIALVNTERKTNGLSPVKANILLNTAAYNKSKDMATKNFFAHTAPDGTTDFDFVAAAGYKYQAIGSNIAMGDFGSLDGLVQAWMNSAGHRANILANYGQEIGVGIYGQYYTMMIAKPV